MTGDSKERAQVEFAAASARVRIAHRHRLIAAIRDGDKAEIRHVLDFGALEGDDLATVIMCGRDEVKRITRLEGSYDEFLGIEEDWTV